MRLEIRTRASETGHDSETPARCRNTRAILRLVKRAIQTSLNGAMHTLFQRAMHGRLQLSAKPPSRSPAATKRSEQTQAVMKRSIRSEQTLRSKSRLRSSMSASQILLRQLKLVGGAVPRFIAIL